MSTLAIYEAVAKVAKRECAAQATLQHLDIGAGRGRLIEMLRVHLPAQSVACDYYVDGFKLDRVAIAQVDIDRDRLPYADASFDLVTCSEVIEHLENFRHVLRETHRVLKPGGLLIVSTPNVLNLWSRVRYLVSGFVNLFGPLSTEQNKRSSGSHITPIPYFYLAHALIVSGFEISHVGNDRVQKRSVAFLAPLLPFLWLGWWQFMLMETRHYRTITPENHAHVLKHFSWALLVGRTLVVGARKVPTNDASACSM